MLPWCLVPQSLYFIQTALQSLSLWPSFLPPIYIIGSLDWGCRSVAEYLPSLCEAPGLNPSTITSKNKTPTHFLFFSFVDPFYPRPSSSTTASFCLCWYTGNGAKYDLLDSERHLLNLGNVCFEICGLVEHWAWLYNILLPNHKYKIL